MKLIEVKEIPESRVNRYSDILDDFMASTMRCARVEVDPGDNGERACSGIKRFIDRKGLNNVVRCVVRSRKVYLERIKHEEA